MYEDKTLVCKECGQEFVFTAGEQEFYAERGFHAAKPAATLARLLPAAPGSTLPPPALPAAVRRRFPLSPSPTVLCTAATASPACAASSTKLRKRRAPSAGALFVYGNCKIACQTEENRIYY